MLSLVAGAAQVDPFARPLTDAQLLEEYARLQTAERECMNEIRDSDRKAKVRRWLSPSHSPPHPFPLRPFLALTRLALTCVSNPSSFIPIPSLPPSFLLALPPSMYVHLLP